MPSAGGGHPKSMAGRWLRRWRPAVFIAHASEQSKEAEAIALALREIGVEPFYSGSSLHGGDGFRQRINEEIDRSAVFVFLVSSSSLTKGRYPLTELDMARSRWPSPLGRVLPVMMEAVEKERLPPYLGAVTAFAAKGDLAAEVQARVKQMLPSRRGPLLGVAAVLLAVAAVLVGLAIRARPSPADCYLDVVIRAPAKRNFSVLNVNAGATNSFPVQGYGPIAIQVPIRGRESWSIDLQDSTGIASASERITGCPTKATEARTEDGVVLVLNPR